MAGQLTDTVRPLPADWLVGGGEMGALIRAKDWSTTQIGPIDTWPQSLRSAVSILLPSKAQIVLFWGPRLVAIYNDAYRPVFGSKHPAALGMPADECWSEVWDVLEPLFRNVVTTGEAFWAKDHQFALQRHGYLEETYFDVSYDPIRDETGRVGGLFCIVSETTGRIIGQRRLAALRDLGRIEQNVSAVRDVFQNAATVLERYRNDVPFAVFYSWNESESLAHLEAVTGIAAGHPGAPERLRAEGADPWPVGGDAEIILADPGAALVLPGGPWPEPTTRTAIVRIGATGKIRTAISSPASAPAVNSTTTIGRSCSSSPPTSPTPSRTSGRSKTNAVVPKSWPNWTAPRRRFSATSATSSERLSL